MRADLPHLLVFAVTLALLWATLKSPWQWLRVSLAMVTSSLVVDLLGLRLIHQLNILQAAAVFVLVWLGIFLFVSWIKPLGRLTWTDPATACVYRIDLVSQRMQVHAPGAAPTSYALKHEEASWMMSAGDREPSWEPVAPPALAAVLASAQARLGRLRQQRGWRQ